MADRRPIGIPVTSTHASPAFDPNSLRQNPSMKPAISDLKSFSENDDSDKSLSPMELSPTLRSISPDSLMHSGLAKKSTSSVSSRGSTPPTVSAGGFFPKAISGTMLGQKKPKVASRVPIATGISTTIPVTGEKPKPEQEGDASLEDDVLYAIFLILYEKDPEGAGMTVKQICDVLVERHPEMAQLSSKTSNLVSAKLNAYVKRVEKGDSNLKYALSREWADASPKRMVYVYRGLLAKDFHVHIKNAVETQKNLKFLSSFSTDSFEAAKQSVLLKPRRQTMFDLGARPPFLESPERSNLFVPYSSAPVAASLTTHQEIDELPESSEKEEAVAEEDTPMVDRKFASDLDFDFDDLEVFDDDATDFVIDTFQKNGKRSKSMSYLSIKKTKFLTAAAAAPRAPKTPSSHSPNAAAAAAALHAAALKAISETSSPTSTKSSVPSSPKSRGHWTHVVRSGFLTQEIGAPEDLSLSDLDKLFS